MADICVRMVFRCRDDRIIKEVIEERPQRVPPETAIFVFFRDFASLRRAVRPQPLGTPQECCLGHFYAWPECPDDSGLDIPVKTMKIL